MEKTTNPSFDPVHDILHYEQQPLDAIFFPKKVAVIGATENPGSVGRTILWNLISSPFGGTVFPVNPKRPSVLGIKAYPSVKDLPELVDQVVVVTPSTSIPGIISDCADIGVKGGIIISAGFKEVGPAGAELERQVLEHARRGNMRIIGPNCLGVMSPVSGLNATLRHHHRPPGQSRLHQPVRRPVHRRARLELERKRWLQPLCVGWFHVGCELGDLIYYLGDDPHTESIVIYMESIGDARAFLSAAREVAMNKPIIVIKPGRTAGAAKAAASHTGSLTGSDDVLEVAFERSGVLRVNTIAELFYMANVLAKQPRPEGRRLTILTNAGGPGVLATDALLTSGGELSEPSPEAMQAYNELLPAAWSHNNPVDIIGDASPDRYAKALEIASQDKNSDGMLVILTPQAMTDPTLTAEKLRPLSQTFGKPILASWMGGNDVAAGQMILTQANIPNFPYPDTAARMFVYMAKYADNLRSLYETPIFGEGPSVCIDRKGASELIDTVRKSGRTILTEYESKQLLKAYCIPTVETRIARSPEDAVKEANDIGYPVVLKLHSETITHKTDVGGVVLNLKDAEAVRKAYNGIHDSVAAKVGAEHFLGVTVQPMSRLEGYELILGSSVDNQFGPVLLFGLGGQLVEVFKDSSLALPPLTTTLARHMMQRTRIYKALKGVRGRKSVDLNELEGIMVRFSQLTPSRNG